MGHISTEYRVVAEIPNEVWREFSDTPEYARMSCAATEGHSEAGSCFYDDPFEWAVFPTLKQAQTAQQKLCDMVKYFEGKLSEMGED